MESNTVIVVLCSQTDNLPFNLDDHIIHAEMRSGPCQTVVA